MRRLLASVFALLAFSGLVLAFAPATVLAAPKDPFEQACSTGGSDSSVCKAKGTNTNPLIGSGGILNNVIDILSIVGGIVVVIMIIVGGIKYITSAGDASATASAKNTIIYGLIGLVVIAMARAIISFVVGRIN